MTPLYSNDAIFKKLNSILIKVEEARNFLLAKDFCLFSKRVSSIDYGYHAHTLHLQKKKQKQKKIVGLKSGCRE